MKRQQIWMIVPTLVIIIGVTLGFVFGRAAAAPTAPATIPLLSSQGKALVQNFISSLGAGSYQATYAVIAQPSGTRYTMQVNVRTTTTTVALTSATTFTQWTITLDHGVITQSCTGGPAAPLSCQAVSLSSVAGAPTITGAAGAAILVESFWNPTAVQSQFSHLLTLTPAHGYPLFLHTSTQYFVGSKASCISVSMNAVYATKHWSACTVHSGTAVIPALYTLPSGRATLTLIQNVS